MYNTINREALGRIMKQKPVRTSFQLNAGWPHLFLQVWYPSPAKKVDSKVNFVAILINRGNINLKSEQWKL